MENFNDYRAGDKVLLMPRKMAESMGIEINSHSPAIWDDGLSSVEFQKYEKLPIKARIKVKFCYENSIPTQYLIDPRLILCHAFEWGQEIEGSNDLRRWMKVTYLYPIIDHNHDQIASVMYQGTNIAVQYARPIREPVEPKITTELLYFETHPDDFKIQLEGVEVIVNRMNKPVAKHPPIPEGYTVTDNPIIGDMVWCSDFKAWHPLCILGDDNTGFVFIRKIAKPDEVEELIRKSHKFLTLAENETAINNPNDAISYVMSAVERNRQAIRILNSKKGL